MVASRGVIRVRIALAVAVALLFAGNAIALGTVNGGSDSDTADRAPDAIAGGAPSDQPSAAAGATQDPSSPTTMPAKRASGSASAPKAQAPTTTTSTLWPKTSGNYAYEVTVTPLCVMGGMPVTATMHVEPGMNAGMLAAYADGKSHGSSRVGNAGPDGLFTATFVTPMAEGPAILLTNANNGPERSGGTVVHFRVGGREEPC